MNRRVSQTAPVTDHDVQDRLEGFQHLCQPSLKDTARNSRRRYANCNFDLDLYNDGAATLSQFEMKDYHYNKDTVTGTRALSASSATLALF